MEITNSDGEKKQFNPTVRAILKCEIRAILKCEKCGREQELYCEYPVSFLKDNCLICALEEEIDKGGTGMFKWCFECGKKSIELGLKESPKMKLSNFFTNKELVDRVYVCEKHKGAART